MYICMFVCVQLYRCVLLKLEIYMWLTSPAYVSCFAIFRINWHKIFTRDVRNIHTYRYTYIQTNTCGISRAWKKVASASLFRCDSCIHQRTYVCVFVYIYIGVCVCLCACCQLRQRKSSSYNRYPAAALQRHCADLCK